MGAPGVAVLSEAGWRCGSARAADLMRAAHERHVPLTPSLADALVRLKAAPIPALDPLWGGAFRLMGEAIGRPDLIGRSAFWRRGVPAFPALVAEPVARRAAVRAGLLPLVGPAAIAEAAVPDAAAALAGVEAEVRRLLADVAGMGRGFWIPATFAMQGAARVLGRTAGRTRDAEGLPLLLEADPLLCRLIFEILPVFDETQTRRRQRRIKARSLRRRSGERPKEGGVAGIRPSRLIDDLPDAVMSELVLPDELMANRLLHEGLLVRHRPPLREPNRDLLAVTLLDRRRQGDGPLALVKAAWADAAVRLRLVLTAAGLDRSDLILADQTPWRQAAHALRVDDAGRVSYADPFGLLPGDRAGLLLESGLMPGFVDAAPQAAAEVGAIQAVLARRAMLALVPLRPQPGRPGGAAPRPADYARRLLVSCLPADSAEGRLALADWSAFRAALVAATARTTGPPTAVAALVVAAALRPDAGPEGSIVALSDLSGLPRQDIAPAGADDPADLQLARLTGQLSGWFVDLATGAIDG